MSVAHPSLSSLREAFPQFILTLGAKSEKKPLNTAQEKAIRLFSETIQGPFQHFDKLAYLSVQKPWNRICLELFNQECNTLSAGFFKRVDKITAILEEQCCDAELISDMLEEPAINQAIMSICPNAKELQEQVPRTVKQLKIMMFRISRACYEGILDQPKGYTLAEDVKRVLFIEIHLRGLDPLQECEWFATCSADESQAIRDSLSTLVHDLRQKTALPESEIHCLLISTRTIFPKALLKRIDALLAHPQIIGKIIAGLKEINMLGMSPTATVLELCAKALVSQNPQKAFRIAQRIDDKEKFVAIVLSIAHQSFDIATDLIDCIKRTKPELYLECWEKLFHQVVDEPLLEHFDRLKRLLRAAVNLPNVSFVECTKTLAKKPFTELTATFLQTVLSHVTSLDGRLKLLKSLFLEQVALDTLEIALSRCKLLLAYAKDSEEYELDLSCLVYAALSSASSRASATPISSQNLSLLSALTSELKDPELRLHVCKLLVNHAKEALKEHSVAWLQCVAQFFTEPEEKLLFLKARVIITKDFDKQKALDIASSEPDLLHDRIRLKRFCNLPEASASSRLEESWRGIVSPNWNTSTPSSSLAQNLTQAVRNAREAVEEGLRAHQAPSRVSRLLSNILERYNHMLH